jgi:hypothetical protein
MSFESRFGLGVPGSPLRRTKPDKVALLTRSVDFLSNVINSNLFRLSKETL